MRFIDLSVSVQLNNGKFEVGALIAYKLATDRRFNTNGNGIRAAWRVEQILKAYDAADVLERDPHQGVEESDHKLLADSCESPDPLDGAMPYPISPAMRAVPLVDVIVNAPTQKPAIAARPVEAAPATNGAAAHAS